MRTLLLGICILITSFALAQRECASATYLEQRKLENKAFADQLTQIEGFVQKQLRIATTFKENGQDLTIIRIPVVVHVLYNTSGQNISDEQIKSQIDALNRDYRRQNADSVNTPARFKSVAADVQIEFALATADPYGRATTGIVRKPTNITYWQSDDKIKYAAKGGDDAWDARFYLNIWVGNLNTLLGYSSTPGESLDKDGVVINTSVFGTINTASPYSSGRTAVHEVGHWLGLKHIWGDTYCGDDGVSDTPPQGNFTPGCPSGFRSTCANNSLGDMYMNYMDYTNDACMNLFTKGQKERMLALFAAGGPRNTLLTSKGLNQPWSKDTIPVTTERLPVSEQVTAFQIYPNPAVNEVLLNFEYDQSWIGRTITLIDMNGNFLLSTRIASKTQKLNITQLKSGMYFVQGENGDKKIRVKLVKL